MSDDILDTIRVVGAGIIGIAIIAVILGMLAPWVMGLVGGEAVWNPQGDSAERLSSADEVPSGFEVRPSAGNAIQLDTEAAHVEAPVGAPSGNWTVCTVAALSSDTPASAHVDVLALDNETITLRWTDGAWRGRYAPDQAAAEVPDSDPTDLTPVCASWNGTLVVETPDGTATAESGEDLSRRVAVGLEGRLDETRVINRSLNASERATYLADPVNSVGGDSHTLRLMYNEGEGDSVNAFYAGGSATLAGAVSWTSGVAVPTLQEGVDYALSLDPLRVTPLSGGYLDGAPYAEASWSASGFGGLVATLFNVGGSALTLLAIGLVVLAARVAMDEFGGGGF